MPNGDFWTSAPPNWHRKRELDRLRQALERAGIPAKGAVRPPLPSYAQQVAPPPPKPGWQEALEALTYPLKPVAEPYFTSVAEPVAASATALARGRLNLPMTERVEQFRELPLWAQIPISAVTDPLNLLPGIGFGGPIAKGVSRLARPLERLPGAATTELGLAKGIGKGAGKPKAAPVQPAKEIPPEPLTDAEAKMLFEHRVGRRKLPKDLLDELEAKVEAAKVAPTPAAPVAGAVAPGVAKELSPDARGRLKSMLGTQPIPGDPTAVFDFSTPGSYGAKIDAELLLTDVIEFVNQGRSMRVNPLLITEANLLAKGKVIPKPVVPTPAVPPAEAVTAPIKEYGLLKVYPHPEMPDTWQVRKGTEVVIEATPKIPTTSRLAEWDRNFRKTGRAILREKEITFEQRVGRQVEAAEAVAPGVAKGSEVRMTRPVGSLKKGDIVTVKEMNEEGDVWLIKRISPTEYTDYGWTRRESVESVTILKARVVAQKVAKEPWQMTRLEALQGIKGLEKATISQIEKEIPPDLIARLDQSHKFVINRAISEGKPVPPEVLADYPDLVKGVAKAPAEAIKPVVSPEIPITAEKPTVEAPGGIPKAGEVPPTRPPGAAPPIEPPIVPPAMPTVSPIARGFRLPDVPPSTEYIAALRQAHPERLKAATKPLETVNGAYRLVLNAREIGDNTIAYVESYVMKHGDPAKLFGITPEGMATNVGNPGNRSLAYVDVLENYTHYTLTPQQREIAQTLGSIYKAGRELALKNGLKIGELPALDEWWQYVARKVTGRVNPLTGKVEPGYPPIGAFKMRGKISAQKQRVFDEMLKGTEEGISYAGPMDTLRAYLRGIYRLIGNKQAERLLLTVTRRGRPQLNERVVSGFVSPQGIGEKYPIWTSRVAQMDVANAIDKIFAYQPAPSALRVSSQVSGALVGQVAAVDISGPFIQGLNSLGHDISMAIRGRPSAKFARLLKAQFDILAQPKSMDSFRRLHADTYLQAIQDGVMTTPFEMVAGTSIAGRVLGKAPVAGKALQTGYEHIWGRFGKAFSGPLEQARILMYEQMAPAFVAEGRSAIEAAEMANLLTGVVSTKALGVSTAQRMAEQTALFAPRFFRANLSVMKYLFESGKTASEMRWAVGSLLGAGAAIYTAMSLAMGQKPKLNPSPKRFGGDGAEFMTIKVGDNYFGIGGWWYAWTKMLAELGSMAVYDPKALVQPDESHPIWKFIRSRASPPVSLTQELVQGEDFMGRELRGPTDYLYQLIEGLTPIWAQSLVKPDPRRDITRAGLEFTGGRTIPLSDLDKLALQKYNVTWNELDLGTKSRLEKTPEVRKILEESPMRREQRLNTEARLKLYDQKVEQDKWVDRGIDAFGNPFTVKQWREKRSEFYIRQSQDIATRERLLGPFKDRKPKNEKETALQDYFKIGDKYEEAAKLPGRGGQIDIAGLVQEREKFLTRLPLEIEEWLQEQLGSSGTNVDDEFRQDKRVIKPYWDSQDALKQKYAAQDKAVKLLLAQRISPTLWPQPIKNYIKFLQAQGQFYRMRNPEVDALLVKWGYFQNPQNPLNKMREKQRELRAVAGVR